MTVYGSSGIRQGMPLTPSLGPVNVPGAWGPSPLVLGDSTNSLFGVLSELLIYSRALSDAELVREMEAIRSELNSRGVTPPIARAIGVSPNAPGGLDNVSFRI